MIREPAVAGQFYPLEKEELKKEIKKCFSVSGEPTKCKNSNKIVGGIAPHAGYVYSGITASYIYKALAEDKKAETIVIIGPNHTGYGSAVSIFPEGEWETPLGNVKINEKLSEKIGNNFHLDVESHTYEHSIEVQIPFLQYVYGADSFDIVAICAMDQSLETMKKLGNVLANTLDHKKHLVIASTDFSHYVPNSVAYENDLKAINQIKSLNTDSFYKTIKKENVSMCGFGGVAALMEYAKKLGVKRAELLKYMTSGDIMGDKSAVVGYGALIFTK